MNCDCTETRITEQTIQGGSTRYVKQCQKCGRSVGSAIKKSSINYQPQQFNTELRDYHEDIRQTTFTIFEEQRAKQKEEKQAAFDKKYQEYMASDLWQVRRIRVLLRDDYKCQGCLEQPATDVHHITYDRLGDELLIDLVSLCRGCHDKIHKEQS